MAASDRLARLNRLVGDDLQSLPDRPKISQEIGKDFDVSDDEKNGGVTLLTEKTANLGMGNHHSPRFDGVTSLAGGEEQGLGAPDPSSIKTPSSSDLSPSHPPFNQDKRFIQLPELTPPTFKSTSPSLPPSKLHKGQLGEKHTSFCPILALAKYPYKFVDKKHSQRIASTFFDGGKFWNRSWDLYYVWSLDGSKPLFVVRHQQYEDLLADINQALNLRLNFSEEHIQEGLSIRFPYSAITYPRYIGLSNSRLDFDKMTGSIPPQSYCEQGDPTDNIPDRSLEAFKLLIEDGFEAAKNKSKALREKKKMLRTMQQKGMVKHLKRAQRYLGLRPKFDDLTLIEGMEENGGKPAIGGIDITKVAPWMFDQDVVFVCVDVESHERAHHQITEVGIATLDTRDLFDTPPGKDGENWTQYIHCRHFRIKEYCHHTNSEFVQGCPDRFEFGTSEFVARKEAAEAVAQCFKPPFCKRPNANGSPDLHSSMFMSTEPENARNIIFLGHDANTDLNYLQQLGYDVTNLSNLVEVLDTATMYRVWKRQSQSTKLSTILYDFDIIAWNLHNAGNDAFYTVRAMLAICVREATLRGSQEAKVAKDQLLHEKLKQEIHKAREQANLDMETWSSDEADDGGDPVKPTSATKDDSSVKEPPKQKRKSINPPAEQAAPTSDDPFANPANTNDLMSSDYQNAYLWHPPRGDYMGNNPRGYNPRGFGGQRTTFSHGNHQNTYNSWGRPRGRGRGNYVTGTPQESTHTSASHGDNNNYNETGQYRGRGTYIRRSRPNYDQSLRSRGGEYVHRRGRGNVSLVRRGSDNVRGGRRGRGGHHRGSRGSGSSGESRGYNADTRYDADESRGYTQDTRYDAEESRGYNADTRYDADESRAAESEEPEVVVDTSRGVDREFHEDLIDFSD